MEIDEYPMEEPEFLSILLEISIISCFFCMFRIDILHVMRIIQMVIITDNYTRSY